MADNKNKGEDMKQPEQNDAPAPPVYPGDEEKEEKQPEKKLQQKQAKQPEAPEVPREVIEQIDSLMRRLRLLEERYSGLRRKSQFTEESMLEDTKTISGDMQVLNETIDELKSEVFDINEKLTKLSDEIKATADKTELNVLAKYLDYWQPLDYITRKEAEDMIKERKSDRKI